MVLLTKLKDTTESLWQELMTLVSGNSQAKISFFSRNKRAMELIGGNMFCKGSNFKNDVLKL